MTEKPEFHAGTLVHYYHGTGAGDMLGLAKRVTWKGTSVAERPEFHAGTLAHLLLRDRSWRHVGVSQAGYLKGHLCD